MPEEPQVNPKPPEDEKVKKKGGVLGKLQEMTPDKDEQIQIIGVAVRLGIVVWSGFILTLAYVDLPGFQKQNFDPTFIASVFTGALAGFSINTKDKKAENGVSKADLEKMLAANNQGGGAYQTIRVETPIKIEGAEVVPPKKTPPKQP